MNLTQAKLDGLVKSRNLVIPAKAGIQNLLNLLDPDFYRNDEKRHNQTFYDFIKLIYLKHTQNPRSMLNLAQ